MLIYASRMVLQPNGSWPSVEEAGILTDPLNDSNALNSVRISAMGLLEHPGVLRFKKQVTCKYNTYKTVLFVLVWVHVWICVQQWVPRYQKLTAVTSRLQILNPGTINNWSRVICCDGGSLMHWKMFSLFPGLYPLVASNAPCCWMQKQLQNEKYHLC